MTHALTAAPPAGGAQNNNLEMIMLEPEQVRRQITGAGIIHAAANDSRGQ
jgi:hypothetical protein